MKNSETICLDAIGPVLFDHSQRARRIVITVSLSKGVRVAIPTWVPIEKALEFVRLKQRWLQKQLARIEQDKNKKKIFDDLLPPVNKADAQKRLVDKLCQLAKEHGFTFNKVTIRCQKTRWGSCSQRNNISLNLKLVLLPEELMNYVMLHELVHTRVHNHSKKFWAELDKFVGNSRVLAKKLRTDGLNLV